MKKIIYVLVVVIIIIFVIRKTLMYRTTPTIGWTSNNTKEPIFQGAIILNGEAPIDYEIAIVDPNPKKTMRAHPKAKMDVFVEVILSKDSKQDANSPPTFVTLQLRKGGRFLEETLLTPLARDGNRFVYKAQLVAPLNLGTYDLCAVGKYFIYGNEPDEPRTLQKTSKGINFNVSH